MHKLRVASLILVYKLRRTQLLMLESWIRNQEASFWFALSTLESLGKFLNPSVSHFPYLEFKRICIRWLLRSLLARNLWFFIMQSKVENWDNHIGVAKGKQGSILCFICLHISDENNFLILNHQYNCVCFDFTLCANAAKTPCFIHT